MDPSTITKQLVSNFYEDFGIKQHHSFSGGFRFIDKQKT